MKLHMYVYLWRFVILCILFNIHCMFFLCHIILFERINWTWIKPDLTNSLITPVFSWSIVKTNLTENNENKLGGVILTLFFFLYKKLDKWFSPHHFIQRFFMLFLLFSKQDLGNIFFYIYFISKRASPEVIQRLTMPLAACKITVPEGVPRNSLALVFLHVGNHHRIDSTKRS